MKGREVKAQVILLTSLPDSFIALIVITHTRLEVIQLTSPPDSFITLIVITHKTGGEGKENDFPNRQRTLPISRNHLIIHSYFNCIFTEEIVFDVLW